MRPCPNKIRVGCPMARVNRVHSEGPVPCNIMLVGEAPGKQEDKKGKPFIGKAGSELTHLYIDECAQLYRKRIYITNLVKCRTNDRDRDPKPDEIAACSQLLKQEILQVRPAYIGAIGRFASRWLLNDDVLMEKVHGFGYHIRWHNGGGSLVHEFRVMPMYHPAYGLHNSTMMRHIMGDFTAFGRMVRGDNDVMWRARR